MIRIAIVEDEAQYVQTLENFLAQYQQEHEEKFNITVFRDGMEIIDKYKANFDVILMDIKMQHMDGMTAAEKIRAIDQEVIIIFITNMLQYAVRGYAVDAMDYIVKPIHYFPFSQRLERALDRLKKREKKFVTVGIRGGALKLEISQIYYIESQDHSLIFHSKRGDFISSGKLTEMEALLAPHDFFRSNKGYLVNLEYVDGIKDNCVLIQGEQLPISRYRKSEFMTVLTQYISEGMK
ncbi:MAG: LytR/AlgR family response regulator transcription factor [Lachnospiraceae bacterium]